MMTNNNDNNVDEDSSTTTQEELVVISTNGEEGEDSLFEESHVTLKKFMKKDDSTNPKWCGAMIGRLRLLVPSNGKSSPPPRIILRQIGTNDLLLNSLVELSTKWETIDTSNRSGVTFSAVDEEKRRQTGDVSLIPHCVIFQLSDRRNEFVRQVHNAIKISKSLLQQQENQKKRG